MCLVADSRYIGHQQQSRGVGDTQVHAFVNHSLQERLLIHIRRRLDGLYLFHGSDFRGFKRSVPNQDLPPLPII
jgi:hypothetical protein